MKNVIETKDEYTRSMEIRKLKDELEDLEVKKVELEIKKIKGKICRLQAENANLNMDLLPLDHMCGVVELNLDDILQNGIIGIKIC